MGEKQSSEYAQTCSGLVDLLQLERQIIESQKTRKFACAGRKYLDNESEAGKCLPYWLT